MFHRTRSRRRKEADLTVAADTPPPCVGGYNLSGFQSVCISYLSKSLQVAQSLQLAWWHGRDARATTLVATPAAPRNTRVRRVPAPALIGNYGSIVQKSFYFWKPL